ncbi:hypothetical protein Rumeso_04037 [Rubellimicrobium mesophilum DSM 19309]|uniref:Peptidase C-terminal archaeal/bacterial domain-containing protein n=1 Tax=Rubellimicrobium mesophilum DSM 19309 TaxID=442562 RepID=A0A017HIL4_9RHOB|nr:PPC domain-containing protein [Rubellimicrobium mesophilum]EYD74352.1 hypothetical protein Rumeso_04037 [Rubellimicrobium mesophilum DSM 19309]
MALVLQNNEYVALFSTSAPTQVRIEAQGRGAGDPQIELRDESGAVVASDDDSGGNGAARSETQLQPGRYCLSMKSYDGSPMTGFVRVGRTDQEALTTGMDQPAQPTQPTDQPADMPMDTPVGPSAPGGTCDSSVISAYISDAPLDMQIGAAPVTVTASVDQTPYWGFTLNAPTAISITAENEAADPSITLYDSYGSYLSENDDWDGLDSRIDMSSPLQPGTYCIAMNALSDTSQPITVSVSAYDAQAAQIDMYDRGEAAPPLDGSYPITALGPLSTRLRQDAQTTDTATWFSFDVSEPGLVLIEAVTNGQGDPELRLFDDFGRQLAYNDDKDSSGGSLDSLVTARVTPGTYLVAVRQLGEGTQALTRLLLERYVPAQ